MSYPATLCVAGAARGATPLVAAGNDHLPTDVTAPLSMIQGVRFQPCELGVAAKSLDKAGYQAELVIV